MPAAAAVAIAARVASDANEAGALALVMKVNLRIGASKNGSGLADRAERLRGGRAAARPLRDQFPTATQIAVRLEFRADETPSHADQAFVLYPAARAYFGFPCPYGDCDGIYDLASAVQSALQRSTSPAVGALSCTGTRSRNRLPGQLCGLQVNYTVTVEHVRPVSVARGAANE